MAKILSTITAIVVAIIGILMPLEAVAEPEIPLSSKEIASYEIEYTPKGYLYKLAPKDFDLLDTIIRCESGWVANAQNKSSSAGGLAQFLDSTWKSTRQRMGLGIGDKMDWKTHLETFVWLYEADGTRHWLESKPCWSK